ncbi:hypothetical protein D6817_02945 [Candidatus Pacearchaeota archaeon]|nr:MAG: hypothetical protein D6817_02945 [Candidatus Pacearchaeota archaeon]
MSGFVAERRRATAVLPRRRASCASAPPHLEKPCWFARRAPAKLFGGLQRERVVLDKRKNASGKLI